MDTESVVRAYYRRDDLKDIVLAALARIGADVDDLGVDDLSGLDHLHAGGGASTDHVLDALGVDAGTTLLDVGSGVGGPARRAAARHGCRVTGIDLSPDFVEVARTLTARVGLSDLVQFEVGSALDMPFADASFDRATLIHVGMNIADKAGLFVEVRRVLRADGRFAVYEQMRVGAGELSFPMPWADDERSSFVEHRDEYARLLTAAGFVVEQQDDLLPLVASAAPPPAGALTPAALFGPGFDERVANNVAATFAGVLRPVLIIARAA